MSVTEILQLMDQLVSKHTGNPLDDLQRRAILGILQHQTYSDIADGINYDEEYIGKISRELYAIVSQELKDLGQEADVKKSNFATSIERLVNSGNYSFLQESHHNTINNKINFCSNHSPNYNQDINNNQDSINKIYHDLTLAPQIIKFYNRETELKTLSDWICGGEWSFNPTRLICVLGLSGIGKTALVKRFVDLNLEQFEVIIWKSLQFPLSLDLLIKDLLNTCQQEPQTTIQANLKQLFDVLTEKKCLIILDDVQNLFITGQLAGQYQPEYKDYQKFFKMITETTHQSNIILISREQCAEMECLDHQLYPIKYLELLGLDDIKFLENTGLNHPDSWLQLIQLYESNPIYLKDITSLIRDVYDGEVDDFLAENSLVITPNMQTNFQELFDKLSPIEQQLVLTLSQLNHPVSREELRQNLSLNSVDFNHSLQSLQQRYLVKRIKQDKIMFKLSPVFGEYVIKNYKNLIEIFNKT